MEKIDLHMHSSFSDGTDTPDQPSRITTHSRGSTPSAKPAISTTRPE